jgi:hypothetical protein
MNDKQFESDFRHFFDRDKSKKTSTLGSLFCSKCLFVKIQCIILIILEAQISLANWYGVLEFWLKFLITESIIKIVLESI